MFRRLSCGLGRVRSAARGFLPCSSSLASGSPTRVLPHWRRSLTAACSCRRVSTPRTAPSTTSSSAGSRRRERRVWREASGRAGCSHHLYTGCKVVAKLRIFFLFFFFARFPPSAEARIPADRVPSPILASSPAGVLGCRGPCRGFGVAKEKVVQETSADHTAQLLPRQHRPMHSLHPAPKPGRCSPVPPFVHAEGRRDLCGVAGVQNPSQACLLLGIQSK